MGEEGLPKRIRLEWEIIMKEEEWKFLENMVDDVA